MSSSSLVIGFILGTCFHMSNKSMEVLSVIGAAGGIVSVLYTSFFAFVLMGRDLVFFPLLYKL